MIFQLSLGLAELESKEIEQIEGGTANAKAILGFGLAVIGVVALFVAPPSAFSLFQPPLVRVLD